MVVEGYWWPEMYDDGKDWMYTCEWRDNRMLLWYE